MTEDKIRNIEAYAWRIKYELQKGIHTFSMCNCGRHGCRTLKCWECWLEDLVEGAKGK